MVQQPGASTLVLAGTNTYTGGTVISAGTVQVTNANSVGTGPVMMNGGTFQATARRPDLHQQFSVTSAGGTIDVNGTS